MKFLKEKPWYFAFVALSVIIKPIMEKIVLHFVDENSIVAFLNQQITVFDIVPWAFGVVVFLVCFIVYCYQKATKKNVDVSPDELEKLKRIINTAVTENEYIESMHAFQYNAMNGQSEKFIKLNHLCGEANERIEINVVFQTYFYFAYSLYKKIITVSGNYDKYINETEPVRKEEYKNTFLESGHNLCDLLLEKLNAIKDESEITEFHCDMYRVLAKMLPTISDTAIEKFLKNEQIEFALIKRKKNGILGSIVLNDLYIFHNINSAVKKNRIYFTFPYNSEKKIVFLGSINGNSFPSEETKTLEDHCKRIVAKICEN